MDDVPERHVALRVPRNVEAFAVRELAGVPVSGAEDRDVTTFFLNLGATVVQDNAHAFDFNSNGLADLADVVELFALVAP